MGNLAERGRLNDLLRILFSTGEGAECSAKNKSDFQCCLSNVERNDSKVGDCSSGVYKNYFALFLLHNVVFVIAT